MLESLRSSDNFTYEKLSKEECQKRGILGRLVGVIADFLHPTRNGRIYKEALWDKTFEDPIMQEKIANRCLFGELGHPEDRTEIDMSKIAICLAEQPKKCSDGTIIGVFDILDTPNGRILKTMCDYGCNIGVSSRGNGDTYTDYDGQEAVDEDTYACECWDAVLIPAVEKARLVPVNESLGNKTFKQALTEALEKASADDKKIMEDTLKDLDISLSPEKVNDIVDLKNSDADNDGNEIIKDLQESLKTTKALRKQIADLQEKLSVSYAKEVKLKETVTKYRNAVESLSKTAEKINSLNNIVESLNTQLKEKELLIKSQTTKLNESVDSQVSKKSEIFNLTEQLNKKSAEVADISKKITSLEKINESLNESLKQKDLEIKKQQEIANRDLSIKTNEYSEKLQKANTLTEKYKRIAKSAVDKYISSRALQLGVKSSDITSRLSESYSFKEIDDVCDRLMSYNLEMSKLPFNQIKLNEGANIRMKAKSSEEPIFRNQAIDDEIDDQLKNMLN